MLYLHSTVETRGRCGKESRSERYAGCAGWCTSSAGGCHSKASGLRFLCLTDIHMVGYRIIHGGGGDENPFKWNFRAYNVITHCKTDTTTFSSQWIRQVGSIPVGRSWVWSFLGVDAASQHPFYKLSCAVELICLDIFGLTPPYSKALPVHLVL